MSTRKIRVKADSYRVFMDELEIAIAYGIRRYWKHRDGGPTSETIDEQASVIAENATTILYEKLKFE